MKYIRTKDVACCFENNFILKQNKKGEVIIAKPNRIGYFRFNIKDIIAQADTIEELCDMCIVWFKDDKYPMFDDISGINRYKELKQFGGNIRTNVKYDAIYLAIWTDKGLIYVAKMNKKGELELL